MKQGAFLMRGLENVRGEFSLTALAYSIKKGHYPCRRAHPDRCREGMTGENLAF